MNALSFDQIQSQLARFGAAIGPKVEAKDPFVVVEAGKIVEICRFLHDEPSLAFDYLIDETAVDYPAEGKLRVVYHLFSLRHHHAFKLKVELDRTAPLLPSVYSVWKGADWLEREVFDLFGVQYTGHPDLRRLMMPDDWEGHPLRKDYKEERGYHGLPITRQTVLDRYAAQDKALHAELAKQMPPPAPPAAAPAPVAAPAAEKTGTTDV